MGRAFLPSFLPSAARPPEAELSPYSIRRVSRFISAAESGRKKSPCQPSPHKAASRRTRCRRTLWIFLSAIHFTDDESSVVTLQHVKFYCDCDVANLRELGPYKLAMRYLYVAYNHNTISVLLCKQNSVRSSQNWLKMYRDNVH